MKKLSEMLNKEINNWDPTQCEKLASKSEEGSEEGAKIIQSTIFYIAVAAICAFCLIYNIIKEFTVSGRNQFSYRNWLLKSVPAVVIAIVLFWLMKCRSKLQIIKTKLMT